MLTINNFKILTIYVMSLLYIVVGIKHFTDPIFFLKIMPDYLTYQLELVYLSGFFEILFGVLLIFKSTRFYASWGIILLLLAVFPANIFLYTSEIAQESLGISKNQALIRLPFQIPLILLAYWHSLKNSKRIFSIICGIIFIPTIIYFGSL